jgi:integrase
MASQPQAVGQGPVDARDLPNPPRQVHSRHWGPLRLDKLTAHHLDAYFGTLATDKKLSAGTIKLDHAVLSGALSQAVDWGWLPSNPAKRAKLAIVKSAEMPGLTVDQLRDLYWAAAADDDVEMAGTIALAALTGCRRGELCGLKWSDVDWDRQCFKSIAPGFPASVASTSRPPGPARDARCSWASRV